MIGILFYIYFLFLGFIYSKYIFDKNIYFHIWIGGIIGNLILMFGIIFPSFVFGFNIISHISLFVISLIPLIFLIKKQGLVSLKKYNNKNVEITNKIFLFVIIPIFLIIAILLTNHILVPVDNGVASGQSTYGDLNMHLGFITSIKEQGVFPPNYAFLSGTKLNYPFFVNMLSSSLLLMKTPLRLSVLIPSYVICLLLVMGFYYLAHKISNNRTVAIISTIFFFLSGGFGFIYFLDGAKGDINQFTRIFTDFYHTPTNFNEYNIRWANPICDMIIPQRSTMAGWFLILPCLYFLIDGCKTKNKKSFIILGILASTLPMIHTHSFLALGVISIGMFLMYFFTTKEKKIIFNNFLCYGLIVLIIGFPQLFIWTFQQTHNNGFLNISFNWVNHSDPYIWFYIKNWGLVSLFIIPSFLQANKDNKKLLLSSLLLFILAEFIIFQPNEYDNNKLFFIVYMIFLINCCKYYIYMFKKLKGISGRYFLSIGIIILSTLSGILTIGRELKSGGEYETFSNDMIKLSEYIKENTDSNDIFLTSTAHINPVVSLAGRNIYVGSSLYVYYHGFGDEYNKRNNEINLIYQSSYDEIYNFCKEKNIKYIYIGEYEKGSFNIKWDEINKFEKVISFGNEELYKIY